MTAPQKFSSFPVAIVVLAAGHIYRVDWQPVAEARPLRVATSNDYAPFSSRGKGFSVDLAQAIARHLGRQVVWQRFRWPELERIMRDGQVDMAVSGITWTNERSRIGWMSHTLAVGSPCVVGTATAKTVAVNRGGFLERWARQHKAQATIVTTVDNRSLPQLYAKGRVQAFVTDSFELNIFRTDKSWPYRCAPSSDRKVVWISARSAPRLAHPIDRWILRSESQLRRLRRRWFGRAMTRSSWDALVDIIDRWARRCAEQPPRTCRMHANPIPSLLTQLPKRVIRRFYRALARCQAERAATDRASRSQPKPRQAPESIAADTASTVFIARAYRQRLFSTLVDAYENRYNQQTKQSVDRDSAKKPACWKALHRLRQSWR